ncbi:unnamed protein product [Leptidea sinapis]|uniref:Beta-glucosidase n=1 Tax=Leptidea sinapis TaxID=189913 RepID=A0A5E4QUB8_9NEOP|nr:unnamed protein product [Leptidea sinapis]
MLISNMNNIKSGITLHLYFLGCVALSTAEYFVENTRKFPDGFMFGAATSAYQIEGAWNVDGKSESVWDHITHKRPCVLSKCETGDDAANSYYLYKEDVKMMRDLGLDFYRFSISWTRILPTGFPDKINEAGKNYYNNLIDEMLKYNITPMVTMFHVDLPQKLYQMGGWTNPYVVDWFSDYARVLFELFGDRVKRWLTINEPRETCNQEFATGYKDLYGVAEYLCAKNVLLAHATAYHIYNNEFRDSQDGQIGIWGQFTHPIFSENGDFPEKMKQLIEYKSFMQGFKRSRLPKLSSREVAMIKGSADFLALNHYSTEIVYRNESTSGFFESPSFYDDVNVIKYVPYEWKNTGSGVMNVPWGIYKLLTKIREDYGNPPVYISENGYAGKSGIIDDNRILYMKEYLNAILDAMEEGSDIRMYTAWSLMDNFEWGSGYDTKYGLYEVNFTSGNFERVPRKSAYFYRSLLKKRILDMNYETDMSVPIYESN